MPPSPKIPIAPGTSWDGHHGASKFWGKHSRIVKMCPHVKPGGGQCGLQAAHCMCMCLLCQAPMRARKRCGALCLQTGIRCPWGADRSPEVSSPEQEPEHIPVPRPIPWHQGLVPSTPPGRVPNEDPPVRFINPPIGVRYIPPVGPDTMSPGICLPNCEPGGHDGLPRTPRKERTPKKQKLTAKEWDALLDLPSTM